LSVSEAHWHRVLIGVSFERNKSKPNSGLLYVAKARGHSPANALHARKLLGRIPTVAEQHQVMFYGRRA
jgi:hypothetical protein